MWKKKKKTMTNKQNVRGGFTEQKQGSKTKQTFLTYIGLIDKKSIPKSVSSDFPKNVAIEWLIMLFNNHNDIFHTIKLIISLSIAHIANIPNISHM